MIKKYRSRYTGPEIDEGLRVILEKDIKLEYLNSTLVDEIKGWIDAAEQVVFGAGVDSFGPEGRENIVYVDITSGLIYLWKDAKYTALNDLTEVNEVIAALQAKDVELDSQILALQEKDKLLDSDITALQEKDKELDSEVESLKAKDKSLDQSINNINEKDRLQDGKIVALENKDKTLDSEINNLKAKDVEIDGEISSLKQAESADANKIAALEQKDVEIDNKLSSIDAKDSSQDSKIAAIEQVNKEQAEIVNNLETNKLGKTEKAADSAKLEGNTKQEVISEARQGLATQLEVQNKLGKNETASNSNKLENSSKAEIINEAKQGLQPEGDYALKSELFSKDYNDLNNKPTIPSIDGLATEAYVNEQVGAKLGKEEKAIDSAKLEGFTKSQIVSEAKSGLTTTEQVQEIVNNKVKNYEQKIKYETLTPTPTVLQNNTVYRADSLESINISLPDSSAFTELTEFMVAIDFTVGKIPMEVTTPTKMKWIGSSDDVTPEGVWIPKAECRYEASIRWDGKNYTCIILNTGKVLI